MIVQILLLDENYSISDIDIDTFNDVGAILYSERFGVSAYMTGDISSKTMLETICETVDAHVFYDLSTYQFSIRLLRPPTQTDIEASLHIDEDDIQRIDSVNQPAFSEVVNEVRVIYEDRDNEYRESIAVEQDLAGINSCLLYTSPSPRDRTRSRMPSSA